MSVLRKNSGCAQCLVRQHCLSSNLDTEELQKFERGTASKMKVRRGQSLFFQGDPFHAIFAVKVGVMKTSISCSNGQEQVTGFKMYGEILGLDGIERQRHACQAIALEDTEVCVIPYRSFHGLADEIPKLRFRFAELMSNQLVQNNRLMLLLGSMCANEKVALFLLNLLDRQRSRGLSSNELLLRMTRQDIASYLGLQLETVSRKFSKMSEVGLISVNRQYVRIKDIEGLKLLTAHW